MNSAIGGTLSAATEARSDSMDLEEGITADSLMILMTIDAFWM
jgi:hypothetical protein